jgi:hypothetical protein
MATAYLNKAQVAGRMARRAGISLQMAHTWLAQIPRGSRKDCTARAM